VGDENFLKLYVCLHNKWNPYSEDIKSIPMHYWLISFHMIRQQNIVMNWKESLEPHAELIGQLTHPEIFQEYKKMKDKIERKKQDGAPVDITTSTDTGTSSYAETDYHYDPIKGLVDANGKIAIPKERFDETMRIDGVGIPVSY